MKLTLALAQAAAVTKALKQAKGEAKAEVYTALGLHLTYAQTSGRST